MTVSEGGSPSRGTIGSSPETGAMAACHFLSGRPPARCTSAWISLQATDRAPGRYSFSNTVTGSCTAMPVAWGSCSACCTGAGSGNTALTRAGVGMRAVLHARDGAGLDKGQHLEGQAAVIQCCEGYDRSLLLDSVPAQLQGVLPCHLSHLHSGLDLSVVELAAYPSRSTCINPGSTAPTTLPRARRHGSAACSMAPAGDGGCWAGCAGTHPA